MTQDSDRRVVQMMAQGLPRRYPAIAALDAYWEALRGARAMPDRHEIDPRGIEAALPHAMVLDRVAPGVARVRIAGLHIGDVMGMEPRGLPLTALMAPEARATIADLIEEVVSRPAVATLSLSGDRGTGRPMLQARMLLAPLNCEDGPGSRLLAGLQALGEIGRTPRRFAVTEVAMRQVAVADWDGPAPARLETQGAPSQHQQPGLAEAQAAYETRQAQPGKPKLRLIKSV